MANSLGGVWSILPPQGKVDLGLWTSSAWYRKLTLMSAQNAPVIMSLTHMFGHFNVSPFMDHCHELLETILVGAEINTKEVKDLQVRRPGHGH